MRAEPPPELEKRPMASLLRAGLRSVPLSERPPQVELPPEWESLSPPGLEPLQPGLGLVQPGPVRPGLEPLQPEPLPALGLPQKEGAEGTAERPGSRWAQPLGSLALHSRALLHPLRLWACGSLLLDREFVADSWPPLAWRWRLLARWP